MWPETFSHSKQLTVSAVLNTCTKLVTTLRCRIRENGKWDLVSAISGKTVKLWKIRFDGNANMGEMFKTFSNRSP
jgi:hypothetical protein